MDPYIEQPRIWSDFHSDLAGELRAQINRQVQPHYVARLTPYETYEVVEVDVGVHRRAAVLGPGEVATTVDITPPSAQSRLPLELPVTLHSVEVHAVGTNQLVTAIEILSPVNKRRGHEAFEGYLRKRRNLLRSLVHFIEIDLLRAGERPPLEEPPPPAPYYAMVSREEHRPSVEVWMISLTERLPKLPVPLLQPDPDAVVDLQAALEQVYERGGYGSEIDYRQPPPPPLSRAHSTWVENLLRTHRDR
jgi:hypothetical protein